MTNPITQPGLYPVVEADYHGDPVATPSLNQSLIKILLDRSPLHAWWAHPKLNPNFEREERDQFDLGSAVHDMILGDGTEIVVVEAESWRRKADQEAKAEIRAEGKIPMLRPNHDRAKAMLEAFWKQIKNFSRLHEAMLQGVSEQTLVWREENGVWCRGRPDQLHLIGRGTAIEIDIKSTQASAHPQAVGRRLFDLGQDIQQVFYRRGLLAATSIEHVEGYIVTQEVQPPFALSVTQLHPAAEQVAEGKIDMALEIWKRCLETGEWPGYPPMVAEADLPSWLENDWIERRDAFRDAEAALAPGQTVLDAG